jgi:hypothetical protein
VEFGRSERKVRGKFCFRREEPESYTLEPTLMSICQPSVSLNREVAWQELAMRERLARLSDFVAARRSRPTRPGWS